VGGFPGSVIHRTYLEKMETRRRRQASSELRETSMRTRVSIFAGKAFRHSVLLVRRRGRRATRAPSRTGRSHRRMFRWRRCRTGRCIRGQRGSRDGVVLPGDGVPLPSHLGDRPLLLPALIRPRRDAAQDDPLDSAGVPRSDEGARVVRARTLSRTTTTAAAPPLPVRKSRARGKCRSGAYAFDSSQSAALRTSCHALVLYRAGRGVVRRRRSRGSARLLSADAQRVAAGRAHRRQGLDAAQSRRRQNALIVEALTSFALQRAAPVRPGAGEHATWCRSPESTKPL
jgi:hypothetical protein